MDPIQQPWLPAGSCEDSADVMHLGVTHVFQYGNTFTKFTNVDAGWGPQLSLLIYTPHENYTYMTYICYKAYLSHLYLNLAIFGAPPYEL